MQRTYQNPVPETARVRGIASYQSATACYIGAGVNVQDSGVFGVYAETKYTFAVNGLPGNPAQASAAAAFFARCVSLARSISVATAMDGVF